MIAIDADGHVCAYEGDCHFVEEYAGWLPVDDFDGLRWEVIGHLETDVPVDLSRLLRFPIPRRGWRAV